MSNDLKDRIEDLEKRIVVLEKQRQILFDFANFVPDCASSAIRSITNKNYEEATEKLDTLQLSVFEMLKQVV